MTNLTSFNKSESITELYINNNEISTLTTSRPDDSNTKKKTVSQLFPSLEVLDVSNNNIADLEGIFALEDLAALAELVLIGNPVCSTPKYKSCSHLIIHLLLNRYPYCVWAQLTQLQLLDGAPVPFSLFLSFLVLY